MFRLIAKALGEKSGSTDEEADKIAWIRIVLMLQAVATNIFIIAGVLHKW
jgi:hypothetical protein